jgi:hypothetical protein
MKYLKLFEEYEQRINEEKSFKGNTVKQLLKAAKRKMGTESFLVQDMDGVDWAVFIDGDTKPGDREVYAMDQYDNEKMVDIKTINLIYEGELIVRNDSLNEAATKDYDPPKFLVLPALDPEGNGIPSDKIDAYMRAELAKRKSYYKPGIRSANPPKRGEEVDRNLDEANININAKPKTRPFNKVKPGNVGLDFYDRVWTVIGTGKYSELEKFDMAGLSDGFENDADCVAVKSDDRLKTAVYSYGEEGFRVFENRFKKDTAMFGFAVNEKRPTLPKKVIPALAKIVKEFTDAYKSFDERDRHIFDLTDALWDELNKMKMTKVIMDWYEENIASNLNDAFRNGLKAKSPSIESIESMLSQLPLDDGWG